MKLSTPYSTAPSAELNQALELLVDDTKKCLCLLRRFTENPGPTTSGKDASPRKGPSNLSFVGPVQTSYGGGAPSVTHAPRPSPLPSTGSGRASEAGLPVMCPASYPLCRFVQGYQQRDYFGGDLL